MHEERGREWRTLLAPLDHPREFIAPPFNFNSPSVSAFAPELTGWRLLDDMRAHLGWDSLAGKRILDLGCGVRFARTLYNLNVPVALYFGIDLNAEAIAWLSENVRDPRFRFAHLNARNAIYNPSGAALGDDALSALGAPPCDVVCMFSVITHQNPEEALRTFGQARRAVTEGGDLYFTAMIDEAVDGFEERDPAAPGHRSFYHPRQILTLLAETGWRARTIYPPTPLRHHAFVCSMI